MNINRSSLYAASPYMMPAPGMYGFGATTFAFHVTRANAAINPATTPLQVGDMFSVILTGAQPNGNITVSRSDGQTAALGFTDSQGNFSYLGAITQYYTAGSYLETWFVNGTQVGNYSFSIGAGTTPATPNVPATGGMPAVVSKGEANGAIYMVGATGLYLFPDYATFIGAGYSLSDVHPATAAQAALPTLGTVNSLGQPVPYNATPVSPAAPASPAQPASPTGGGGSTGGGSTGGGDTSGGDTSGSGIPSTIFGLNSSLVLFGGAALLLVLMAGKR